MLMGTGAGYTLHPRVGVAALDKLAALPHEEERRKSQDDTGVILLSNKMPWVQDWIFSIRIMQEI